jgi:alkylation response protein AidB-like acyl-CoA dehydrogenase
VYFGFSDEQVMLRESVRRFLDQRCPIKEVRKLKVTPKGYSEELWQEMAKAGWLGINLPEQYGGLGLGWLDLVVIIEEMGRGVFPSPFISNTLAASTICDQGNGQQKQQILPSLVDGSRKATLALFEENSAISVASMQLRGEMQGGLDGGRLVLNGVKRNVMDPGSADYFVVSFRFGDATDDIGIALVDAGISGVTARAYPLIDATKRMGNLSLENVVISTDRILTMGPAAITAIEKMIDQGALALSAEMTGAMEAALEITVKYAGERTQFGHPIGHFQAVKHPLAEILVDLESCRSLLYYGTYAHDQGKEECTRVASMAKAYATDAFTRAATDAIQIHGATGYMTEVDIHLYYLRSKWARPLYGDSAVHYERAFVHKLRAMESGAGAFRIELDMTDEESRFRDEVREFLAEHNTPPEQRDHESFRRWLKAVRSKRYVGFSWPQECGGYGGTVMQQFILKEEMLNANAQMLGTDYTGLGWVGPAVIQFGTEEQKQRFLPPILDSKTVWCTGYSEPGVGSDLASLQCKAVLVSDPGDDPVDEYYLVNGQKIWTSLAHIGTDIYCLVRTDFSGEKHEGITCLLIPLDTPGIEVRPLKSFAGDHFADLYNEVFFTDVKVPVANRIGREGEGWQIICSALQNERSGIAEVNRHHKAMDRLIKLARKSTINGKPALENDEMRKRLSAFDTRIEASRLNGLRALTRQVKGEAGDSEASLNKLHNCHLLVNMADTAMELLGGASPYVGESEASVDGGKWQIGSLGWPTTVIGGGTPNIQRNIIAERILGLPKD